MKPMRRLTVLLCMTAMMVLMIAVQTAMAADKTIDEPITAQSTRELSGTATRYDDDEVDGELTEQTTYHYTVIMPDSGTLILETNYMYYEEEFVLKDSSGTVIDPTAVSDIRQYYYFERACKLKLDITVKAGDHLWFAVIYAPAGADADPLEVTSTSFSRGISFGVPVDDGYTAYQIKAAETGYLQLRVPADDTDQTMYCMVDGFKGYVPVMYSSSYDQFIGVRAGQTYTVKVKNTFPMYKLEFRQFAVNESKFGKSGAGAVSIKKNSFRKGLIITDLSNKQNVHYYKIKNPKLQKVKLVINTARMSRGNSVKDAGLKVTVSGQNCKQSTKIVRAGSDSVTINLYNSGSRLKKGSYVVKVERYNGGNGYYKIKWK